MPSDRPSNEADSFVDFIDGTLEALGSERGEFRQAVESAVGDDTADLLGAVATGVFAGQSFVEQRRSVRQGADHDRPPLEVEADVHGAADHPPLVRSHPIDNEEGMVVAIRVLCSDPSAEAYRGDAHLLVRADGWEQKVPVPDSFEIGEVSRKSSNGIAEWVVRRETRVPALPGDVDDDVQDDDVQDDDVQDTSLDERDLVSLADLMGDAGGEEEDGGE